MINQIIPIECSSNRIVIPSRLQQHKTELDHSLILYIGTQLSVIMLADYEPQQIIPIKCSSNRIVIPSRLQHHKTELDHSLILYWYVSSLYVICDIM